MPALAGETCGQVDGFALDKSPETGGEGREQSGVSVPVRLARMALLTACMNPKISGD
jgi:hypothetical protein